MLEDFLDPTAEVREEAFRNSYSRLRALDPNNKLLTYVTGPNWVPSWQDVNGLNSEIDRITTPSPATIAMFQRQLDQNGVDAVLRSQASIQENLQEHIDKLPNLQYTSSVNREIRTFSQQLRAIDIVLGR